MHQSHAHAPHTFSLYAERRKKLVEKIKEQWPDKNGILVFFADFETDRVSFRQESSFYYLTGIREPGVVLTIDLDGQSTLYVPQCSVDRSKWLVSAVDLTQKNAELLQVHAVEALGEACPGYQIQPFFNEKEYKNVVALLRAMIEKDNQIYTCMPTSGSEYVQQRYIIERLAKSIPDFAHYVQDVSSLLASMRRIKSMAEIELMYEAVSITQLAHEAAAQAIAKNVSECEVQASLEYIMTGSCAKPSFPSIVASGMNGTVLHYTTNAGTLKAGELVVVDIGAEYEYYCADLTRTYPVSGKFTDRQRELYTAVLDTQKYIADLAAPGYWLSNKEHPDKSLNHLAHAFLKERGLDEYFIHGIGHYLGLDVHDVGDYATPLEPGDVITIEPGVYLPQEGIGIRIEDNYWIVADGAVCLSEELPKEPKEIEELVAKSL